LTSNSFAVLAPARVGGTFALPVTKNKTPIGNQWFRNRNNQFPLYVRNPTHRSRLSKRSIEPDFNRHPEKTDRY
jgi:hypothetical protein